MRIRELHEIRYDEETASLKFSGLNAFQEAKSVTVSIDNPELFLNVLKTVLKDSSGKPVKLGKVG